MLSLVWNAVESGGRQVIAIAMSFAILVFVTPHDLGAYALAFSFVLMFALIIDDPIGEALIQRPSFSENEWNTGFTLNLAASCTIFGAACLSSRWIAHLFSEPTLRYTIPALSSCIVIGSLGNIQRSFLTRELRFSTIARISPAANLIAGAISVGLAAAGAGYWAMVTNLIVTNVITSTLYWRASSWKPRLVFHRASFLDIRGFAGQSFAYQCVLQFRESILPLTVGWFGGATAVGFFSVAMRLARTVGLLFEDMTRRPIFTTMSSLHHSGQASDEPLLKIITVTSSLSIPAFLGMAAVGPSLLPILFGSQWAGGGSLIPYFCVIVFGWLTLHIPALVLRARGSSTSAIVLMLVPTVIDTAILIAFLRFGLQQALFTMAVRAAVTLPILLWSSGRGLGLSGIRIIRSCGLPICAALVMAGCLYVAGLRFGHDWRDVIWLGVFGAVAYLASLALGYLAGERQLYNAFRSL